MTLQPADLDRLEQLAREATPGPWTDDGFGPLDANGVPLLYGRNDYSGGFLRISDLEYIAALSPAVVSELVAAARLGAAWQDVAQIATDELNRLERDWARLSGDYPNSTMVIPIHEVRTALTALAEALREQP